MSERKIGTFLGVIVPNMTMMFGVILFLRLGVVTAHTGLLNMMGVLGLGLFIMLLTSGSIASIVSNMEVGDGGVYYLVTRTLGIEVGGALGYALYASQILCLSLTSTAFAYALTDSLLPYFPSLRPEWVEALTLFALGFITNLSTHVAVRLQVIILGVLFCALGAVALGSNAELAPVANPSPFYEGGYLPFWMAFAIVYPAMTGIEAGMALSGTLKNPSKSLMYGNALSLIIVVGVFAWIVWVGHTHIPHDLLMSDPFAYVDFANPSGLVLLGILVASLSSALGNVLGAPRILQSMAQDGIAIEKLAEVYGPSREPRPAIWLTIGLALVIALTTSIDQVLPMLTMICLLSYGLLNAIACLSNFMNAPSWQPEFRIHWGVPLLGLTTCLVVMFMISPGWSFLSIALLVGLYMVFRRQTLDTSFEDWRNSILFFLSRLALYRLAQGDNQESALTWHPKVLLIVRSVSSHINLAHLMNALTRQSGLLTMVTLVPDSWATPEKLDATKEALGSFIAKENIECINEVKAVVEVHEGTQSLIQTYGIGHIQPNTVVLPLLETMTFEEISSYHHACYLNRKNLIIYKEASRPLTELPSKLKIDVWWVNNASQSFALTINLLRILKDSPDWRRAKVHLKAVVDSVETKQKLKQYLKQFTKQSRLSMEVSCYINRTLQNPYEQVVRSSNRATLVLLPALDLVESDAEAPGEDCEQQIAPALEMMHYLKVPTCLVQSHDDTQHQELFNVMMPVKEGGHQEGGH